MNVINRYRVVLPDHEVLQLHRNTRPELYDKSVVENIRLDFESLSRYPDIDSFLILLSKFIGIGIDNIMLSSGIDGAIRTIFETYTTPGCNVLILTPTYKMYEVYAEAFEVNLTKIQSNKNLSVDLSDILRAIPDNKILFIPNPHEPVENIFSCEQIIEVVKEAKKYGTLVVIDEAYFLFGAPSVINEATKYNNLLVMRSFSKGFGLPSIRLGYTVGDLNLITKMQSRRLAYETNSVSMNIAAWAMNNFDVIQAYINEVIQARSFIKGELNKAGFITHGSFSNTILINLLTPENTLDIFKKLRGADIWVRELTEFCNINTWISVTLGRKQTAQKFLDTFFSITKSDYNG